MNNWTDTLGAACFVIVLFAMAGLLVAGLAQLLRSSKTKHLLLVAVITGLTLGGAFAQQYYGGPDNSTQYQQMPSQLDIHPSAYGGWNCSFGTWWSKMVHFIGGGFPWHLEN